MPAPETKVQSALKTAAEKNGGLLSFRDFMQIALFEPGCGYYTSPRERVGKAFGTDFYTAASAGGELFGKLIYAATETLTCGNAKKYSLVEIGAEPSQSHFDCVKDFFAEIITIRVGRKIEIPENSIVIANELLDAQPFHRLVFKDGKWREIGVFFSDENKKWLETILTKISTEALKNFISQELPKETDEDWRIDISLDAETLLEKILSEKHWHGAIIFLDYGKTLTDCLEAFPGGTARAYFHHTQTSDLLANPGEQDLTCHVMWNRLKGIAIKCGFKDANVLRQEAFFMKNSFAAIQEIADAKTLQHTEAAIRERTKLLELIHPGNMGHLFQVLSGVNF